MSEPWSDLPGAELVERGIQDLSANVHDSVPALCVSLASHALKRLGVLPPEIHPSPSPDLQLFEVVARETPRGSYSRYLALLERVDSFLRAREHQIYGARRVAGKGSGG